jgi:hypothetical protein
MCPPAKTGFPQVFWGNVYLPYTGKSVQIFKCPDDGANGEPKAYTFNMNLTNVADVDMRCSYIYAGLDLWKAAKDGGGAIANLKAKPGSYRRKIIEGQHDQDALTDVGYLACDKDFVSTTAKKLASVHGITTDPAGQLRGVGNNTVYMDSSVHWSNDWKH